MASVAATAVTRRSLLKGAAGVAGVAAGSLAFGSVAHAQETASNRVCQILGIEKPVVQALMTGLTSPQLAAAVSEAGGLGILELPSADTIATTKALTDKPFCAAVYSYDDDTAAMLKENGVNIVICANGGSASDNGFTVDTEPIAKFKEQGFTVLYKGLNPTRENMLAVQEAGADIIAVLGMGSGGCGGRILANTSELISEYSDIITVPMLAAGGIVNAKTAGFAAAAGAEGAYVGTRFLASDEAPCADATKQAICEAKTEDLVPVPWQAGSDGWMPMTPSALRDEGLEMAAQGIAPADIAMTTMQVYINMASGDIEDSGLCVGAGVGMVDEVLPAADIVDDIASGFGL